MEFSLCDFRFNLILKILLPHVKQSIKCILPAQGKLKAIFITYSN